MHLFFLAQCIGNLVYQYLLNIIANLYVTHGIVVHFEMKYLDKNRH